MAGRAASSVGSRLVTSAGGYAQPPVPLGMSGTSPSRKSLGTFGSTVPTHSSTLVASQALIVPVLL